MNVAALLLAFAAGFTLPYLIHWLEWSNDKRRKQRRARDFFGGER